MRRLKAGKAVVVTAEEIIDIAREKGISQAAREVDVGYHRHVRADVLLGAYFNIGQPKPRIKLGGGRVYLNGVPAYAGFAAADFSLGVNALPDDEPRNRNHPRRF